MSSFSHFLMNGNQVRELTGTSQNVEDRKLTPLIKVAQQGVEEQLGRTLYALVETAHTANPSTMGGAAMLTYYIEYIQPAIAWRVLADAGVDLTLDYDRNGPIERTTDGRNGDYKPGNPSLRSAKVNKAEGRADNYMKRLVEYTKGLAVTDPIRVAYDAEKCKAAKVSTGPFVFRRWAGQGIPIE